MTHHIIEFLAALALGAMLMAFGSHSSSDKAKTDAVYGNKLMTINYHKEGGKQLLFGTIGYYHCQSKLVLVDNSWEGTVTCQGEGWATSWRNWELSDIETSKGKVNGKVLGDKEKRMLQAVDRKLRKGKAEGKVVRSVRCKAEEGMVDLTFIVNWSNGNSNGDADITLTVKEVIKKKGEHELVGNWQYVKSAVAIHWDDPAPFHDSAAQEEEKSERKDMTINADGSMTMVARDVESGRVYRDGDSCAMKFKSYDLTWVLSAATDSLKVMSPSGGSEMWRIDQLDGNTLVYVVDKPFESHMGSGILTYTYTYRRR